MYRTKRARSVAHSIAHHGVSALSWLHPRLGEECIEQRITMVAFDLLTREICSENYVASRNTSSAVIALCETFAKIAKSEGIQLSEISKAEIEFSFKKGCWPQSCSASIGCADGKEVSTKLDGMGRKYNMLSEASHVYSYQDRQLRACGDGRSFVAPVTLVIASLVLASSKVLL